MALARTGQTWSSRTLIALSDGRSSPTTRWRRGSKGNDKRRTTPRKIMAPEGHPFHAGGPARSRHFLRRSYASTMIAGFAATR